MQIVEHVQFPERTRAIERRLVNSHHLAQRIAFTHGVGQFMQMNMVLDGELRIVLHHRMRKIQRDLGQPLPVAGHQMHPLLEVSEQSVKIDGALEQPD